MTIPDGGQYQQPNWDPNQAPQQTTTARRPRNGMGTAALVFGVLALLTCWLPVAGGVLAVVAIILAVIGRGRAKRLEASNKGAATTGLVLGVLSLVVNVLLSIALFFLGFAFLNFGGANTLQQFSDCVGAANNQPSPAAVQQAYEQCTQQFGQQLPGGSGGAPPAGG